LFLHPFKNEIILKTKQCSSQRLSRVCYCWAKLCQ